MKKIKSIILPSSYLPSINYFYLIIKYENILIETSDFYIKQSLRNHTTILGPNGDQKLTIPICRKNKSKTIFKNLKIANKLWQKKHLQAIKTAYGNSPFFIHYVDEIFKIINTEHNHLIELNSHLLTYFLNELEIKKKILYTNEYIKDYGETYLDCRKKNLPLSNTLLSYSQTFSSKNSILENYSIIDLLFNTGNESKNTIISILKKNK